MKIFTYYNVHLLPRGGYMSRTISFSLDLKSIQQAIKQLDDYKKEIIQKNEEFVAKLAEEGVAIAQAQVMELGAVLSGELVSSLDLRPGDVIHNGAQMIVYTDCPWAAYVEFGTGVIGESQSHPNTDIVGWRYDVNEHGEKGWWYHKDGRWHWTKGMPSRPFMYNTANELSMQVVKIAKEVFG